LKQLISGQTDSRLALLKAKEGKRWKTKVREQDEKKFYNSLARAVPALGKLGKKKNQILIRKKKGFDAGKEARCGGKRKEGQPSGMRKTSGEGKKNVRRGSRGATWLKGGGRVHDENICGTLKRKRPQEGKGPDFFGILGGKGEVDPRDAGLAQGIMGLTRGSRRVGTTASPRIEGEGKGLLEVKS